MIVPRSCCQDVLTYEGISSPENDMISLVLCPFDKFATNCGRLRGNISRKVLKIRAPYLAERPPCSQSTGRLIAC